MGLTFARVRVAPITKPDAKQEFKLLVDSGSEFMVLPKKYWSALGLEPSGHAVVDFADGRESHRDTGYAFLEYLGNTIATNVILGEKDDSGLLGVIALEQAWVCA